MSEYEWHPSSAVPPLKDHNAASLSKDVLKKAVDEVVLECNRGLDLGRGGIWANRLRQWGCQFELRVLYPDGDVRPFHIDFEQPQPAFSDGPSKEGANAVLEFTASGLHDLHSGRGFDRILSSEVRAFHTIYQMTRRGVAVPPAPQQGRLNEAVVPDPLDMFMRLYGLSHEKWVRNQLEIAKRGL